MTNRKDNGITAETPAGNVEIYDEDAEVITLHDDKNNPVDFIQVACVEFEGRFYALLKPAGKVEGIDEDEVVIFRLEEGKKDGEDDLFVPVESEELLNKVFDQYLRAAADENDCCCGDGDCDCGDDSCDCDEDDCDCGEHHK